MNASMTDTKPIPRVRRVRVYPRLSLTTRRRLSEYCARKGITERDAIEDGILQLLDGTSDGAKVLAQLQRIAIALDAAQERRTEEHLVEHQGIEVLSEAFGRFVRLWMFVHVATFRQPATREAAESLYREFAAKIGECFKRGHRLAHDVGTSPHPKTHSTK